MCSGGPNLRKGKREGGQGLRTERVREGTPRALPAMQEMRPAGFDMTAQPPFGAAAYACSLFELAGRYQRGIGS